VTEERSLPRFLKFSPAQLTVLTEDDTPAVSPLETVYLGEGEEDGELLFDAQGVSGALRAALVAEARIHIQLDDGINLWAFRSTLIDRDPSTGTIHVTRPEGDGSWERLYHRKILRIAMQRQIELSDPGNEEVRLRGVTENVGGGGCALRIDTPLAKDQAVRACVELVDEGPPLCCLAHVIECSPAKGEGYRVRLQFENLTEEQQTSLLQACFREQLERRRRDLTS
jgi:c-di-GMP-binding flagellar brake protein YcgR